MTSERIPQIAIATALVFGVIIFLESGKFILPFGLFKPALFICTVIILIAEKKKLQLVDWLLIGWTTILAATSTFVLQFFFSEATAEKHAELMLVVLSFMQILGFSLLFLWQIAVSKPSSFFTKFLQITGAAGMLIALLLNSYFWLLAPTVLWFLGLAIEKKRSSSYGMALLLFFAIISCWVSGYFFGMESIVAQL